MSHKQIYYSDKYDEEEFEYRHVMLPKDIAKLVPKSHLMSESEWRNLGVQQSQGWVHYMIHEPESHIFTVPEAAAQEAKEMKPANPPSCLKLYTAALTPYHLSDLVTMLLPYFSL